MLRETQRCYTQHTHTYRHRHTETYSCTQSHNYSYAHRHNHTLIYTQTHTIHIVTNTHPNTDILRHTAQPPMPLVLVPQLCSNQAGVEEATGSQSSHPHSYPWAGLNRLALASSFLPYKKPQPAPSGEPHIRPGGP